jgi:hypothetical protein
MEETKFSGLLDFWILSIVRYSEEHRFGSRICFRPHMKMWETPTLSNEPNEMSPSPHTSGWKKDPVPEIFCSLE